MSGIETGFASPVEEVFPGGRKIYVKRDDRIDSIINGNKARKLYFLMQTPDDDLDSVYSWGGSQSNAMLALATLALEKGWEFVYFTSAVPRWLLQTPVGNFKRALSLGMKLRITGSDDPARVSFREFQKSPARKIFIPQGGADSRAEEGIRLLAEEIRTQFFHKMPLVVLSSGTGTMAVFLRRNLPGSFPVWTVPAAGDASYLIEEMIRIAGPGPLPRVLEFSRQVPFGMPDRAFLLSWKMWSDAGVPIDLIYDAKLWATLLEREGEWAGKEILFVHSGGTEGNESQLARYRRAGLLEQGP